MPMLTTSVIVGPDAFGELRHPVEHGVHVQHDVVAVDLDHRPARCPQGDVEHGTVLGRVDPLAGEHRVAPCEHPGVDGVGDERRQQVVVDRLLGVVDAQIAGLDHVPVGTAGIAGEQLGQRGQREPGTKSVELVGHRRDATEPGSWPAAGDPSTTVSPLRAGRP
jgi:hypothetical protein